MEGACLHEPLGPPASAEAAPSSPVHTHTRHLWVVV